MRLLHLFGLPPAASTYAADIDFGLRLLFASIVFVFFSWSVYLAYLVFRYRNKLNLGLPKCVVYSLTNPKQVKT